MAILNELADHFERLEDKRKFEESLSNFTDKFRSVWKDIMIDTGFVLEDVVDLGSSHLSLEVVFKSLARLESQYVNRVEQLIKEVDTLPAELSRSFHELGVKLRMSIEVLLKAIHLLYLHSHDTWFLHLNMLLYATVKSDGTRKLYCLTAVARFLTGRTEEALALAAYAAELRVKKPSVEPWRDPEAWARALRASYYLDVGVKVIREILSEYNFKEHFEW
ncbi:MAG: hypothetical protein QXF69_04180 [Thermofilaceae archaeon]